MTCPLCNGACTGADLAPLLIPELSWFWEVLAAAGDRRGDEALTDGPAVTVTAPTSPTQRAAAAGLIPGRPLVPGQRRRVELGTLTAALAARGPKLTPGAVAAHARGQRLAQRAKARTEHTQAVEQIRTQLEAGTAALPPHIRDLIDPATSFDRLRGNGWITRILNTQAPAALLEQALQVAARLPQPGERIDRRTLVSGAPHALDEGPLPALVLALTGRSSTTPRAAWARLGVDLDDLLGGLIITGVTPQGWHLPSGATFTLPPRELAKITWTPPPTRNAWVFVTENPSVLAAASTHALEGPERIPPRVICTAGTPSQTECAALGALAQAGWNLAIRADFDEAGLAHMRAMLTAAPDAVPWRMGAPDYLAAEARKTSNLVLEDTDAPWDPDLVRVMRTHSSRVYEEDLLPMLLADIAVGRP